MKIRIELDEKLKEDEVLIRTSRLTDEIAEIQKTIVQTVNNFQKFTFYKGTTEYFLERIRHITPSTKLDPFIRELRSIFWNCGTFCFLKRTKRVFVHIPSTTFIRRSISSMNGKICCRAFLCGCQNPPF